MKKKIKLTRLSASLLAAGCLLLSGGCAVTQETLTSIINEVIPRQTANLLSDTVFFLLDNALVRLTN